MGAGDGKNTNEPSKDAAPSSQLKKERSRYILLNAASGYARNVVDTIVFLILIPFIISKLGNSSFGLWSLIWSFLAIFELADLGFAASVIKYVADARGRQDSHRLREIVCTLFWIYSFLGTLVMLGAFAGVFFFDRIFQIPDEQVPACRAVLVILGIRSGLYLPLGMFRGIMVGFQKLGITNIYKTTASLLYLVSVLILLNLYPDIRVLAAANLVTGILPMFAMVVHCRHIIPDLSLAPRNFSKTLMKELSSFSLFISFSQISEMLATRADAMIIKLFLPLEAVGIYSIGMRLSETAGHFCSHLTRALSPVFAELHGADEQSNVRAAHYTGSKLTVAFAAPLLLGLGILAEPLIVAWTGPYYRPAVPVCQILAVAGMIGIIHANTVNLLNMSGHQKYVAMVLFCGQTANVILSFLLIRPLGIAGVSLATLIAAVPVYIGLIEGLAGRVHSRTVWDFYKVAVFPCIIPGIIMAGILLVILYSWKLTNLFEIAAVEIFATAIFCASYWFIGFRSRERKYFKDRLIRILFRRDSHRSGTPAAME